MSLEILALFAILLSKAQKAFAPVAAANDHQQAANQAASQAADAAARGDHATAAQKSAEAAAHQATAANAAKAARTPPPWPQVVPAGLPPFPGAGWQPASPVTSAQTSRAWQLLPELWKYGEGTWRTEKTADRWTTYKAVGLPGGKKGVVAYTMTSAAAAAAPTPEQSAMARNIDAGLQRAFAPAAPGPTAPASAVQPAPKAALQQAGVQTLRLTTPRMTGPTIVWLQQRLGVPADGVYGPGTMAAVQHYQAAHGLTADGVVGPATWASLGVGIKAAA